MPGAPYKTWPSPRRASLGLHTLLLHRSCRRRRILPAPSHRQPTRPKPHQPEAWGWGGGNYTHHKNLIKAHLDLPAIGPAQPRIPRKRLTQRLPVLQLVLHRAQRHDLGRNFPEWKHLVHGVAARLEAYPHALSQLDQGRRARGLAGGDDDGGVRGEEVDGVGFDVGGGVGGRVEGLEEGLDGRVDGEVGGVAGGVGVRG